MIAVEEYALSVEQVRSALIDAAQRSRLRSAGSVANVSSYGSWLLVGTRERFVPRLRFPWLVADGNRGQAPVIAL